MCYFTVENIFQTPIPLKVSHLVWIWDLVVFHSVPYKPNMRSWDLLPFLWWEKQEAICSPFEAIFLHFCRGAHSPVRALSAGLQGSQPLCGRLWAAPPWTRVALERVTADGAKAPWDYGADKARWPHYEAPCGLIFKVTEPGFLQASRASSKAGRRTGPQQCCTLFQRFSAWGVNQIALEEVEDWGDQGRCRVGRGRGTGLRN